MRVPYRFLRPRRDATLVPSHPTTAFWNAHSMFLESSILSGRVGVFWTCCVLILFFLQCIICSARTHVLKMLGLAITEYTSLMVTVKTSHGYKFRVGFMNQEDRCFFYGRTWINFLKCYGLKVGARMLMEIAEPGLIFTAIFHPRRRSNCSSMLVLYLVLACCLDYFLIHLFCLTNHNLTLEVATNLSRRCYF